MSEAIETILARIEAKQDAMMEKLDRLEKTTDTHWKKIAELETKLAVLEQRQGPRVHWVTWVVAIVAALGFVLAVADRLYITNLTP
jgi:septal ring factor EnvC (AmiA/AmiB activator)